MLQNFKIEYAWWKRPGGSAYLAEMVEATGLFVALRNFIAIYEGQFQVHIGNLILELDFQPDLSTIFEELPDALESLISKPQKPTEIYFFEQGTDLNLIITPDGPIVTIDFIKGHSVGPAFTSLPNTSGPLLIDQFLREWILFIRAILEALVLYEPSISSDESYQSYCTRFDSLVVV